MKNEIIEFAAKCQDLRRADYDKHGYTFAVPGIEVDFGRKYAKLVSIETRPDGVVTGRSAFCFVNMENGDVLKSASWAKPAKHARGNILDASGGMNAVNPYGANYLM